jgi:cobalamin biosynthesis protein CobT
MGQYSNQNQNQSNQGMGVPEKSEDGSESSEDKSEDGSESSEDGSESSEDKSEDGSESSEDGSESSEDSSESSSSSQNTVNVDRSGEEEQSGGSISIDLSDQSFKNKEDYLQEDAKNNPDKNVDGDRHSRNEDLKAETYNVNQMVDCDDEYLSRRLDNKLKSVDRALKLVNVSDCSQTLSRILKNPDRRGSKRHRDRGKLDVRKLGKLCTNTPNMFYQPWKQKGTKTAVSLLIDTSSSMRDRDWGNIRVNNAKESINLAMILGNALHKVQVKYAVGCYPYAETQRGQVVSLSEGTEYYDDPYTLLKDHDHNWIKSKKFIASQHGKAGGGTPTHQAMMAEGLRLRKRSEDRKVMIIITDGAPNSIKRTQQAKKIMAKWGIEVIGLILCLYKIYAHIDPQQQKRLDEFVKDFDGCFDHFVVEGSAKDMIKKGLHDLNKILR